MDAAARKINTAKFQYKKASVLVVTDVAARGIDIPSLDYVVNVHFPGKPKLFVHRVGRCARAGRSGTAYSIFSTDDEAHLLDLHLFLNRPFNIKDRSAIGIVPADILEEEHAIILQWLANQHIVSPLYIFNLFCFYKSVLFLFSQSGVYRTSVNAYKKYISTRPPASVDSNKRVKNIKFFALEAIDDFNEERRTISYDHSGKNPFGVVQEESKVNLKDELVAKMKNYRPSGVSSLYQFNFNQFFIYDLLLFDFRLFSS